MLLFPAVKEHDTVLSDVAKYATFIAAVARFCNSRCRGNSNSNNLNVRYSSWRLSRSRVGFAELVRLKLHERCSRSES